jgi:hypothetical protein
MSEPRTETTMKVPKEHVEAFRLGVLRELENGGDWLKSQADEVRRELDGDEHRPSTNPDRDPFDCIGGPLREIQHDAEVLRQLGTGKPRRAITVEGEASSLKHSTETLARFLSAELSQSEFGGDECNGKVATLSWAVAEAKRLEAEARPALEQWGKERRAAKLKAVTV